jgi:hypothetical protein
MEGGMREKGREGHPLDKAVAVFVGFTIAIVIWHVSRWFW